MSKNMTPIALKGKIPLNVEKFLMLITHTEGTDRQKTPYNELFGYDNFNGFEKHPNILVNKNGYKSTAAGRYQVLYRTWLEYLKKKPGSNFSPDTQDDIAIFLIKQKKGAYQAILDGNWETAIKATNTIWASLPGSPYGQPTHKMADALKFLNTL